MAICEGAADLLIQLLTVVPSSPNPYLPHPQSLPFPFHQVSLMAIREGAADLLVQLLTVASPDIRAAAVFGLGCLVHSCPEGVPGAESGGAQGAAADHLLSMTPTEDRLPAEQLIANAVRQVGRSTV